MSSPVFLSYVALYLIWFKPNGSPQRLNLSSLHARTLVILSDERAFMTIMPDSEFIYTYDNGSGNWVGQDIRSPIAVGPHGSILLRSPALAEEDCLGLDEEIYLFSTGKTSQCMWSLPFNVEIIIDLHPFSAPCQGNQQ